MNFRRLGFSVVSASIVLTACASTNKMEKMQLDCRQRVAKAMQLYQKKKYSTVLVRLEDARMQCSGSPIMDTVLFYLGMSNIKTKKYIEGRTEFQRLTQDFPGSPFFDEAKFRIGYSVFKQSSPSNRDQTETREAVRLFDDFIDMYPKSAFVDSALFYRTEAYEKLAVKEFKNAQFYEKFNEPEAAVVYYRAFMGQFTDSKMLDLARFNALTLLLKLGRDSEARELFDELMEKGTHEDLKKQAKTLFASSEKKTDTTSK